jgi:transposase
VCAEPECPRGTFTAATEQFPVRARCTTRLRTALLSAVIDSGRAVAEVAAEHGVAWWTVQATVNAAAMLLPNVDELHVRRLGIDEHRYRRVRWFRDPDGAGWRRVEPWMSTIVNADCGRVLGIVDGRDSAAVGGWLSERSQVWRNRIRVVAIDPSAAFNLTWLNLVSRGCVLDGIDGGSGVGVEGCSGVEEVVAGLDGDAAVVAQCRHEFLDRPAGLAFEPVADS